MIWFNRGKEVDHEECKYEIEKLNQRVDLREGFLDRLRERNHESLQEIETLRKNYEKKVSENRLLNDENRILRYRFQELLQKSIPKSDTPSPSATTKSKRKGYIKTGKYIGHYARYKKRKKNVTV